MDVDGDAFLLFIYLFIYLIMYLFNCSFIYFFGDRGGKIVILAKKGDYQKQSAKSTGEKFIYRLAWL